MRVILALLVTVACKAATTQPAPAPTPAAGSRKAGSGSVGGGSGGTVPAGAPDILPAAPDAGDFGAAAEPAGLPLTVPALRKYWKQECSGGVERYLELREHNRFSLATAEFVDPACKGDNVKIVIQHGDFRLGGVVSGEKRTFDMKADTLVIAPSSAAAMKALNDAAACGATDWRNHDTKPIPDTSPCYVQAGIGRVDYLAASLVNGAAGAQVYLSRRAKSGAGSSPAQRATALNRQAWVEYSPGWNPLRVDSDANQGGGTNSDGSNPDETPLENDLRYQPTTQPPMTTAPATTKAAPPTTYDPNMPIESDQ